jgi:hypothetical protein
MKLKPLIALVMFGTLVLSVSTQSLAKQSTSSVENKSLAEETPHITNEAEYAEFVKRREGIGQASSVKSTRSIKSSSSSAASSNRSKTKSQL